MTRQHRGESSATAATPGGATGQAAAPAGGRPPAAPVTLPDLLARSGDAPATSPPVARRPLLGNSPWSLALVALAAALWFTPAPWLVLGFPLLAGFWWRRHRALGAAS